MSALIAARRTEFLANVWDHAADAFQASFDERRDLNELELEFLMEVHSAMKESDDKLAALSIQKTLLRNPTLFSILIQIIGLTRNKIISDLRGSSAVAAANIRVPSSYISVPESDAWQFSGPYLVRRLRAVVGKFTASESTLRHLFEALNQSTWPGYIRQERAKRSGHEAEYRLATLFASLNFPFEPGEKAENPLCRDAQIDEISFDIVVPTARDPQVVFKSTVHTANIGQYGESKDHLEVDEARRWIDTLEQGRRPLLMALIDGVGFRSNSAGLNGVLEKSDEFCQFKTIWKAALVCANKLQSGIIFYLPDSAIRSHAEFIGKYAAEGQVRSRDQLEEALGLLEAGEALILTPDR